MKWIGNRYVDESGAIVAQIRDESPSPEEGVFVTVCRLEGKTIEMGCYIDRAIAARFVEAWYETFYLAPQRNYLARQAALEKK